MKGDYKIIPFLGVNKEPLDDQSPDGLCDDILNLRPKGVESEPYWSPIPNIETLKGTSGSDFFTSETEILNAYWQILTSQESSLDDFDRSDRRLILFTKTGLTHKLLLLSGDNWSVISSLSIGFGNLSASFARLSNLTVISISKDEVPLNLYYLKQDEFIENVLPELPEIELRLYPKYFTTEQIDAGNTLGIPSKVTTDQFQFEENDFYYFQYRVAYKMFDSTEVKHGPVNLVKVPPSRIEGVYFQYATYLKGFKTMPGNIEFWKDFIQSAAIYVTNPKDSIEDALNESIFYELSEYSGIKDFPLIQDNEFDPSNKEFFKKVKVNINNLPARSTLEIDNFTNHTTSANYIDVYNRRLLAGGVSSDLSKPYDVKLEYLGYSSIAGKTLIITNYTDSTNQKTFTYQVLAQELIDSSGLTNIQFTGGAAAKTISFEVNADDDANNSTNLNFKTLEEVDFDINNPTGTVDVLNINNWQFFGKHEGYRNYTSTGVENNLNSSILSRIEIVVEIDTDRGTFYRNKVQTEFATNFFFVPGVISYPDRRATKLTIYKYGTNGFGSNFLFERSYKLTPQRNSNYAYASIGSTGILSANNAYFYGSQGGVTFENPAPTSFKNVIEKNEVRASLVSNPFVFDAAATYNVAGRNNSTVKGFAVNSIETSLGQFGEYPVYVFTDVGIYALEQTGNPEVAFGRLTPVSAFHTLSSNKAFVNAERLILFVNSTGVYTLSGNRIEKISDPVGGTDYFDEDFHEDVRLGFSKNGDDEEIFLSNPSKGYSIIYNVEYQKWYRSSKSYSVLFNDYPTLYGVEGNLIKDFSEELNTNVDVILRTRPFNMGNPYADKRLRRSILRSFLIQENSGTFNLSITGQDGVGKSYELRNIDIDSQSIEDIEIISNRGSVKSFILGISGAFTPETRIYHFETNTEVRNVGRIRR